ncbi:MAG TPA: ABC transporter ATP-binding protein [Myxococcaceae bacterium]|nr:ABC transporter ATP-binding protein [Myxococcaceae bacterium]
MSAPEALLATRGLTRQFGGVVALAGLDLEVRRGELLGLIGPNGSGKTTFFNVLTGLFSPTRGEVLFAGTSLAHATPQAICRAGITRTFQRSRLCLELSIFDNLAIGAHQRLEHGLWFNVLRRAALARQADATAAAARELLQIFDPPLARRLFEPMTGVAMIDRRRVEICRALMSHPRLLLLDEPSAGMTADETTRLMDDILEVRRRFGDLTIVLIEHEMSVIERVTDRCVVLNYGKKLCEGTFAEVSADPEVRRAYLGLT